MVRKAQVVDNDIVLGLPQAFTKGPQIFMWSDAILLLQNFSDGTDRGFRFRLDLVK